MTRSSWLVALVCCLGSGLARAADPSPQDFAFGLRVEASGAGPIWELALPEAVYRGVTRADLGDLRVFNAAGAIVPHALRLPKPPEAAAPAPVELPVFPLYHHRSASGGQVLRIVTNERGAVIDASSAATPADGADRVEAYLVDASALERAPRQLRLDWRGTDAAGFAVAVAVDASDDLAHWQTIARDMTIADLRAGESVLTHRDIGLPERKAKYLRITWPERLRRIELAKVSAVFAPLAAPAERQWLELSGTPGRSDPVRYDYDSGGQRAVDRVRLVFPGGNALLRGTLQSAATPDGPWRVRHTGIHYSLRQDDAVLESAPVELPAVSDRYWRLVPEGPAVAVEASAPGLALGWTPHRLRFVAQGEPPYVVAFGSASSNATRPLLATLEEEKLAGLTVSANATEVFDLGGTGRLHASPWRTWLLWGVLLGGLALLAWMVRRLAGRLEPIKAPPHE